MAYSARSYLYGLFLSAVGAGALACSRGGDSGAGATPPVVGETLEILSCSLGCSSAGEQLVCGPVDVHVNVEIAVEFNRAIDPATLDGDSFQVIQVGTGAVPAALYRIDPGNPKRVLYRPVQTGQQVLGLVGGASYALRIPGTDTQPEGARLASLDGRFNARTLSCTLVASRGALDLVPGAPRVDVFLDVVDDATPGGERSVRRGVLANGGEPLRRVAQDTEVELVFDDIMHPATLVDPVTGKSLGLAVAIDADGDLSDSSDQIELSGTYSVSYQDLERITVVHFVPDFGLPSAGSDAARPRTLVVRLPPTVVDLGGHSLVNGGEVAAIPEVVAFAPVLLPGGAGEDFTTRDFVDTARTGALWGPLDAQGLVGALLPGGGGGTGRLGDLVVPRQTVLELDTDSSTFSGKDLLRFAGEPATEPVIVDDAIFEFASVTVEAGATLRFRGSRVPRLFARGLLVVDGTLDVSGASPGAFQGLPCDVFEADPASPLFCVDADPEGGTARDVTAADAGGQRGGDAGPGGAPGGDGGDLTPIDASLVAAGGLSSLATEFRIDGAPGAGVPYAGLPAGGGGPGVAWPTPFPLDANDLGGAHLGLFPTVADCTIRQMGGNGGGGGGALAGGLPSDVNLGGAGGGPVANPRALGGAPLGLTSESFDATGQRLVGSALVGGGGGGGGGAGVGESATNGVIQNCVLADQPPVLIDFVQARGSGGGGGGGAVQLQAGARLVVGGLLDASGGDGGSVEGATDLTERLDNASSGGGGGGGSVLLEAAAIELPGLVDISGGRGGQGAKLTSRGGAGGTGRIQVVSGADPGLVPSVASVLERLLPAGEELLSGLGGQPLTDVVLKPVPFAPAPSGPGAISGAQSCWLRPAGNVFETHFFADEGDELGWDMELLVDLGTEVAPVSFRRPGALLPISLEEAFGNELGSSPIVVRFQAARALAPLADPCGVPEENVFPGSLTPWVGEPALLNDFHGDPLRRANMIRFAILFDRSHEYAPGVPAVPGFVQGVKSIAIRAQGE